MDAPLFLGMHHVALATANFARLREFYVETLGLPVLGGFPGENLIFIGLGGSAIELSEEPGPVRVPCNGGWTHLALDVADLDDAYAALVARGVPFHIPPEEYPAVAPLMRIAFCTDPDGNVIELIQPLAGRFAAPMDGTD